MVLPTNEPTGPADLNLRRDVEHVIASTSLSDRLPLECHPPLRRFIADCRLPLPELATAALAATSTLIVASRRTPTTAVDIGRLLLPDIVDALGDVVATSHHPAVAEGLRHTLTMLGRISRPDDWDDGPSRHEPDAPYAVGDLLAFYRTSPELPWLAAQRLFSAVTIGVAIGATHDDQLTVNADDIVVTATGSVTVRLPAPERMVPAVWPFETALRRIAQVRRGHTLSGVGPMSRSALDNLPADAALPDVPRLDLARLRATWLAWHLSAGTPLPLLAQVGGPTLLDDVARVLPYLGDVPARAAGRWLTLGGRS